MREGEGRLPLWTGILEAAESWGVPAWVVADEEPTQEVRLKWFQRFLKWNEQRQATKFQGLQNLLRL